VKYAEFLKKTSLTKEEILANTWATLVEDPPPEGIGILPAPPMLMFDRITHVSHDGPRGRICAEQDIHLDAWFFQCHFRTDPVQPGCLGVDAVWQLVGFYATLRGAKGAGRALGAKEIEFIGQIRPHDKIVTYDIDIRRYVELPDSGTAIAIGDAEVRVDGDLIYTIKGAKAGIFTNIRYAEYPHRSANSRGGQLKR
jgi:3-hydroxyacyl-[acyl-carrier protein] dehydratase / trans-2-decenoyl-[acyl-carrier protein] isomerase